MQPTNDEVESIEVNWGTASQADHMSKLNRITIDPQICLGQPTIRGMRITVSVILKMVAAGKSVREVIAAYPELEPDDVQQALQYAAWVVSDQLHISQTA